MYFNTLPALLVSSEQREDLSTNSRTKQNNRGSQFRGSDAEQTAGEIYTNTLGKEECVRFEVGVSSQQEAERATSTACPCTTAFVGLWVCGFVGFGFVIGFSRCMFTLFPLTLSPW